MGKFSMNDLLNSQSKTAAKPAEHAAGNIVYIDLDSITPSPVNAYGMRDIEELAANIESLGLLHNLVVRETEKGKYEIISGERRYRACTMLRDGGNNDYKSVPCKIEAPVPEQNEQLTELKLICANATARELTDYERTYQAKRIKELLQEMKANGYKFGGRLREIAAEMLKVSPAQMGRMESINKNLLPELTEEFKAGNISITQAYELSTATEQQQAAAAQEIKETGKVPSLKGVNTETETPPVRVCSMYGGECTNVVNFKKVKDGCAMCCAFCTKKYFCGMVCKQQKETEVSIIKRTIGDLKDTALAIENDGISRYAESCLTAARILESCVRSLNGGY